MRKTFTLILFLFASTNLILGQVFEKNYTETKQNQDRSLFSAITDGGFLTVVQHLKDGTISILKTNNNGIELWRKKLSTSPKLPATTNEIYSPIALKKLDDGNYVVAGQVSNTITDINKAYINAFIYKFDANANLIFSKHYDLEKHDFIQSFDLKKNGSFILSGLSGVFGTTLPEMFIMEIFSNGNLNWSKKYSNNEQYYQLNVKQVIEGNNEELIFIGSTLAKSATISQTSNCNINNGFYQTLIGKTDKNGNLIWSKAIDIKVNDNNTFLDNSTTSLVSVLNYPSGIVRTEQNEYIINGTLDFGCNFSGFLSPRKPFVLKFDDFGNIDWAFSPRLNNPNIASTPQKLTFLPDSKFAFNFGTPFTSAYNSKLIVRGNSVWMNGRWSYEKAFLGKFDVTSGNYIDGRIFGKNLINKATDYQFLNFKGDKILITGWNSENYNPDEGKSYHILTNTNANTNCSESVKMKNVKIGSNIYNYNLSVNNIATNIVDKPRFFIKTTTLREDICSGPIIYDDEIDPFKINSFYPNPAKNELYIDTSFHAKELVKIKITNIYGVELNYFDWEITGDNQIKINLSDKFKSGNYILNLSSNKKNISQKFFIDK